MKKTYLLTKDCCKNFNYDGSLVPIPQDLNSNYGDCYKCCCISSGLLKETSKVFKYKNDFMYNNFYSYDKDYKEAFKKCNSKLYGDLDGQYFHKFRICIAKELRWNIALDFTKTYYFLNEITKKALKKIEICKPFKFEEVYIEQSEDFLGDKTSNLKECIGLIYKYTTVALRGLLNFTSEYGHQNDIFFYYKSDQYRDSYRKCLRTYIIKSIKNSREIYDLLRCSHKRTFSTGYLVSITYEIFRNLHSIRDLHYSNKQIMKEVNNIFDTNLHVKVILLSKIVILSHFEDLCTHTS